MVSVINIRSELEQYVWESATWTDDKLIARSPFRGGDRTPSFYVWLSDNLRFNATAGMWGDPGAEDNEWRSGGFVKLLAFLRNEDEESTREYLRYTYEQEPDYDEPITLNIPKLTLQERVKPLDSRILDGYKFRSPYLGRRGISEAVQRLCRVGYDRDRHAVTIPWFLPDGRLANILYRRTDSKIFWYHRGGMPIRSLLYGIDIVYSRKLERAAIVEAPIDAMYIMTAGFPAIAIGGASFNADKRDLIVRSPLEEVIVFADNDAAGAKWKAQVCEMLSKYVTVKVAEYPTEFKDPCEIGNTAEVMRYIEEAEIIKNSFLGNAQLSVCHTFNIV